MSIPEFRSEDRRWTSARHRRGPRRRHRAVGGDGLTRPWNDPVADFDRAAGGPASAVLVGEVDGATIAAAMVGHDGHRGWVYYLAVQPDEQGRGHGVALMRACEAWIVDHGIAVVRLMVRDTNERVLGFYEAMGYERQEVRVLGRRLDVEQARLT